MHLIPHLLFIPTMYDSDSIFEIGSRLSTNLQRSLYVDHITESPFKDKFNMDYFMSLL